MVTMNNNRLSSANTSEGHGISPTTTLEGNHPPGISRLVAQDKPGGKDTSLLVVDWDGPDDPKNPKK